MNRRSFISGLIRVGAFAAFDPHRVIFDMGRSLFLPKPFTFVDLAYQRFVLGITQPNEEARLKDIVGYYVDQERAARLQAAAYRHRISEYWLGIKRSDYPAKLVIPENWAVDDLHG